MTIALYNHITTEKTEEKQLIFMAIKSSRGQVSQWTICFTKPAPANVGIAGNTCCIRTITGAYVSRSVPSGRATFNCGHADLG